MKKIGNVGLRLENYDRNREWSLGKGWLGE